MADYLSPYTLGGNGQIPEGYRIGGFANNTDGTGNITPRAILGEDCIQISYKLKNNSRVAGVCNIGDTIRNVAYEAGIYSINNYVIDINGIPSFRQMGKDGYTQLGGSDRTTPVGMALYIPDECDTIEEVLQYARENNPWKASGGNVQIPVRWKGLEDTFEITVTQS